MKKTTVLVVVLLTIFAVTVSATLLEYYGRITTTANVSQAILLSDFSGWYGYDEPIEKTFGVTGGWFKCFPMKIKNDGGKEADIDIITEGSPDLEGIIVSGYEVIQDYNFQATSVTYNDYNKPNGLDVDITITVDGYWVTWTFDFPVNDDPGDGNMAYGLVIGTSDSLPHPLFQIHNNDGTDNTYACGTHLYSEWGPEGTGYNGWHTSNRNTPVDEIDWIECSGERQHNDNPDGIFKVSINISKLFENRVPDGIIWSAHFGAGGFYNYGGMSKYPEDWQPWSGDISEGEIAEVTEWFYDSLSGSELFLLPGEIKYFLWCYGFDIATAPGTYTITSWFEPTE